MASLDPSIILGAQAPQDPLAQYAKVAQIQGIQNQNRLADLQFSQAERQAARQNKLTELLGGGGTPDEVEGRLLRGGYLDESLKYGKDRRENLKADTERGAKTVETVGKVNNLFGSTAKALLDNPATSYQDVVAAAERLKTMVPKEFHAALDVAGLPQDAQGLRAALGQLYTSSIETEKLLADATSRRNNDQTNLTSRDNNAATNATSRANNAATVGATIRGQNMADARQRESTLATMTKPFEVTGEDGKPILVQQDKQGNIRPVQGYQPKGGGKPLTEGQAKDLLFGSRMTEANKVLDDLERDGKLFSTPGSRTGFGVGSAVNLVNSSAGQKLDQAKRNFINATLRRESGAVIADSEFSNAEQQYFPQPGDSAEVIAQKRANRETAMRGILAGVPESETRVQKVLSDQKPARPKGIQPAAPKAGAVVDGYRFKGGDPSDQGNWEKQ